MESPNNAKEYLIFGFLCILVVAAGIYLTFRANRFDSYYDEKSMLVK